MTKSVQSMEALLRQAITTTPRFRWAVPTDFATDIITRAYTELVTWGHGSMRPVPQIAKVAEFITKDDRRQFGLFIHGGCGTGKSTIARALQLAVRMTHPRYTNDQYVTIYSAKDIAEMTVTERKKVREYPCLVIDDFGTEETVGKEFGNVVTRMSDLLEYRYNNRLCTIITTNLSTKDVRTKYGERIGDRFNEMMIDVKIDGNTNRTNV